MDRRLWQHQRGRILMALIFSNHDLRHLPGKASRLTEVLTEGIGSIEGGVEEENYKYQLSPLEQLKKQVVLSQKRNGDQRWVETDGTS